MPKILAALALRACLACASLAEALSPPCLPSPLPDVSGSARFALTLYFFDVQVTGATLWRQPCTDGSGEVALLIRLTPFTANPFVCSRTTAIVQGGTERGGEFTLATSGTPLLCGHVAAPMTVVLLARTGDYDEQAAFTLINRGLPETSISIPAGPPLPPPGPPTLTVQALGCTSCQAGDVLGFELHVINPGAPLLVELKTGIRLPGRAVESILGRHEEKMRGPRGTTVIPLLAGFVLPAGVPAGAYAIEAALLEPELGVTLSRSRVPLTLGP